MSNNLINNTEWLAGYAAYERGETCPWGESYRAGWIAAKADQTCDHSDGTVERVAHGYLGDAPRGTVQTLCVSCGAELSSTRLTT